MNRYSKIIVLGTAVALMACFLPWLFHFTVSRPESYPFALYSCVTHRFAYVDRSSGENVYRDVNGSVYTNRQFDSILPTFYYRQLIADERLPAEIDSVPVDARSIQQGNFMFRHIPQHLNVVKAPLYFLLESMSGRVDLKMPDDVFRMGERMEFIDMATNRVDEEKSRRFTQALLDKGFVFPALYVAGNQTVKKDYDEGFLMIDGTHQVFHVKQMKGRPFVRNTGVSADLGMKYAFMTEFRNRRYHGFLTDKDNRVYVLEAKTYLLKQLPLPAFNPEMETMTIVGDSFYWTMQVAGDVGMNLYAVRSKDYALVDTMFVGAGEDGGELLAEYLFPFELSFTSYNDKYVYPRITDISLNALFLNLLLAVGYMIYKRREFTVCWSVVLLFVGIFALFPLFLLGRKVVK